ADIDRGEGGTMKAISKRQPRRGRPLIGVTALAVICAVLAAGCSPSQSSRSGSDTPAASAAAAHGNASTLTPNGSALEGIWRTGNLTAADMAAVLSRARLQKWIQPFRAKAGLGHSNAFLLTIATGSGTRGGRWTAGRTRITTTVPTASPETL